MVLHRAFRKHVPGECGCLQCYELFGTPEPETEIDSDAETIDNESVITIKPEAHNEQLVKQNEIVRAVRSRELFVRNLGKATIFQLDSVDVRSGYSTDHQPKTFNDSIETQNVEVTQYLEDWKSDTKVSTIIERIQQWQREVTQEAPVEETYVEQAPTALPEFSTLVIAQPPSVKVPASAAIAMDITMKQGFHAIASFSSSYAFTLHKTGRTRLDGRRVFTNVVTYAGGKRKLEINDERRGQIKRARC